MLHSPLALHRMLGQPSMQEGSPGEPGFPREDEAAWAVQPVGSAAKPSPCRGSWQTASAGVCASLPNLVPGASRVMAWSTLDAAFLPGCRLSHCTPGSRSNQ